MRREEMAALASKADPGGTVWSRFNLSEILPDPTPMTWAIVRRFMSGRGGFGLMYRDLGFDPDPALDEEGTYDLVCGRPYCNLSREPRMQYRTMPFEHPFTALKSNPQKALYPQAILNPARGGWRFWLLLPLTCVKLIRSAVRVRSLSQTFAKKLREEILPGFAQETSREAGQDLTQADTKALLDRLEYWIERTLCTFARDSLKPTALAGIALATLERNLTRPLGAERTRTALGELVMGVRPDQEADLPGAISQLAAGQLDRAAFLERFGHRGSHEMELAQPRWSEDHAALDRITVGQVSQPATDSKGRLENLPHEKANWESIATEAKLSPSQRTALENELQTLHTYLSLRETAKHYLMRGYALIRRILIELDRRYKLDGGIFYLTPEELPRLAAGEDMKPIIAERRKRREIALSLEVPPVLFSDDLDAIGRPASLVPERPHPPSPPQLGQLG